MLRWVVYLAVCAIVWVIDQALTARRVRVQTAAKPSTLLQSMRSCGVAPAVPVLPPDGNWCGCCGRPCPAPGLWCDDCLFHIRLGPTSLHDQTWYAQHGTICPFTDLDDDSAVDDVAPRPSRVSSSETWSAAERDLFDEIRQREARHERGAP